MRSEGRRDAPVEDALLRSSAEDEDEEEGASGHVLLA